MEINVGDYVRVEKGIGKVVYLYDNRDIEVEFANETIIFFECNITKHSKDIIDLIEVGDVIEFKEDNDLYRVNCIPNEECGCNCFYLEFNYAEKYGLEDIMVDKEYMKTHLKRILTKQQFEANAYTIEKER